MSMKNNAMRTANIYFYRDIELSSYRFVIRNTVIRMALVNMLRRIELHIIIDVH